MFYCLGKIGEFVIVIGGVDDIGGFVMKIL